MANGYNPYVTAGNQQNLIEGLLSEQGSQATGNIALKKHKGEMIEDFDKELIAEEKRQKAILDKKRKKSPLEKLMPLVSFATSAFGLSPIIGGVLGGVKQAYGLGRDKKAMLDKASALGKNNLENKWGGTFLGSSARKAQVGTDSIIDQLKESASSVSDMDFLTTGLQGAIEGFTTGELGEGVSGTFEGLKSGDVLMGKDAGMLKNIQESGLDFSALEDSGALITEDSMRGIGKVFKGADLSKLSKDQMSLLENLGSKLGTDSIEATLNQAFNLSSGGKETFLQSLFGTEGLGKDPSTLLGGTGNNDLLKHNLMNLLMLGDF